MSSKKTMQTNSLTTYSCRPVVYTNNIMEQTKFGQRIKDLRTEKKLSQENLAAEFCVHRTTVKDWEIRNKEPSYVTLCKLAQFFEVSTDYLLGLED